MTETNRRTPLALWHEPRIGSRRWIAWKLVRVAHRLHDATYYERVVVRATGGDVEILIAADDYGSGVFSIVGLDSEWSLDDSDTLFGFLDDDDDDDESDGWTPLDAYRAIAFTTAGVLTTVVGGIVQAIRRLR